jgi:hypothetical protein
MALIYNPNMRNGHGAAFSGTQLRIADCVQCCRAKRKGYGNR